MGGIYPGHSAVRIDCDHLPPMPTVHGGSSVQGQDGGLLMWYVSVQGQDGGYTGPGVSQVVQAKVSPQLRFAWGHPA